LVSLTTYTHNFMHNYSPLQKSVGKSGLKRQHPLVRMLPSYLFGCYALSIDVVCCLGRLLSRSFVG
jgi:hypothetical protein